MSLPVENKRICFLLLNLVLLLVVMAGPAGCRRDPSPEAESGQAVADGELWPLGDGSSWFNVMEAGANPVEAPRIEMLAGRTAGERHVALKDRFWLDVHDRAAQQGLGRSVPWRHSTRKKGCGVAGPDGLPGVPSRAHYWVFY